MEELIGTNVFAVPMIDMLKKEGDGISSVFDQLGYNFLADILIIQ